jgi:hypothetical protein
MALLGDAAHPFLPHQGQGGAVALEDAAALGVVLERGLKSEEVETRLQLYQQIRKYRADRLQQYTRLAGEDLKPGEPMKLNMMEYIGYNFGYDEHDNSTQKLREWKWSKQPSSVRTMPFAFGPMPGSAKQAGAQNQDMTFTTASIKVKTSRTVLQNLLPIGSTAWKFKSFGSVAFCSFVHTAVDGTDRLSFLIHGVVNAGPGDKSTSGDYMPVQFENSADAIIFDREVLGVPSVYSDIGIDRGETKYSIRAGWRGSTWGTFELSDLQSDREAKQSDTVDSEGSILVEHQGDGGCTTYQLLSAFEGKPVVTRTWIAGKTTLALDSASREKLPTLHHIIERLAEIPVTEIVTAKVTEGSMIGSESRQMSIR